MGRIDTIPKSRMINFLELKQTNKIPSLVQWENIYPFGRTKEAGELFASDNGKGKLLPSSVLSEETISLLLNDGCKSRCHGLL